MTAAKKKTVKVTNTHASKSVSLGPNYIALEPGKSCEIPKDLAECLEAHPWLKQ